MKQDFEQLTWNENLLANWMEILEMAFLEDIGDNGDITSLALVPVEAQGAADIVARQPGVLAGEPAIGPTLGRFIPPLKWTSLLKDGDVFTPGQAIGRIEGSAQDILVAERILLNFLGRMAGVATLTRSYVDLTHGTKARIYDTRKTIPGWRLLDKYAVRCGGGCNHRLGLFAAVLIKDNHLALVKEPADAVARCKQYIAQLFPESTEPILIEVEVDTLEQLAKVLPAMPDIVLLDNMSNEMLARAVAMRNSAAPKVEFEASGGVNLDTVRNVALTGVERISVGALTHSAVAVDFGLDWL